MNENGTSRYPYLKFMMADFIKELCEENHLDLSLLKTKETRIEALQTLPTLRDKRRVSTEPTGSSTVMHVRGIHH